MPDYSNLPLEELLKYTHDKEAWYQIGMSYWKDYDFVNATVWLEKAMNDPNNEWANKAAQNLGMANLGLMPNASKDEALRLFEKSKSLPISKLHAGFLYYYGTESNPNPDVGMQLKGKRYIEDAIQTIINMKGNDNYLKTDECFKIGKMYAQSGYPTDAKEYFKKSIDRADRNYSSDRRLIEKAEEEIQALPKD